MKAATSKELKQELNTKTQQELLQLCLGLSRFKKENKELLTYLLFESENEALFVESVKGEIDLKFVEVNKKSPYFIRKSIRAILNYTKKNIRYSKNKATEVELILYFCEKMKKFRPSMHHHKRIENIFFKQIEIIQKKVSALHEDLQYDYELEINNLLDKNENQ